MKTRCPACGTTFSLDAIIAHDGAREAVAAAFRMSGPLGSALIRYLALFRPETRELTMDRVAKLLGELLPAIQAQRISRSGVEYSAPVDAWLWAIDQALQAREQGRLKTPLKTHGWLFEVITRWRSEPGTSVAVGQDKPATQSRMGSGLAALENWRNG